MSYILDFLSKQHTNRDVTPSGRSNATVNVTMSQSKKKTLSLTRLHIKVIKSELCIDIYLLCPDATCYRNTFYVESFYIGGFHLPFKPNIEYM